MNICIEEPLQTWISDSHQLIIIINSFIERQQKGEKSKGLEEEEKINRTTEHPKPQQWRHNDSVYDGTIIKPIYYQYSINYYMPKHSPMLRWPLKDSI